MKNTISLILTLLLVNLTNIQAGNDFISQSSWSTDVLINSRPCVQQVCLKFYRPENRLFAILRIIEFGKSKLSVNMSEDFGNTWEETFMLELPNVPMRDLDATIYEDPFFDNSVADTMYVAYIVGELQKWIVLRKFSPKTGEDLGVAGATLMQKPIKELALLTDPGDPDDLTGDPRCLRAVLLMEPTGLKGFIYNPLKTDDFTWLNFPEHEAQDAQRALDFTMYRQWKDENHLRPRFFISYISTEPMLCMLNTYHSASLEEWQVRKFPFANATLVSQNKYTSISCHSEIGLGCTAFLASECKFNTDLPAVKYFIKYHKKSDWPSNDIGTDHHYAADVLTREDYAIGVVYNQEDPVGGQHKCLFKKKWLVGLNTSFMPEVQINDYICNPRIQPSLEWIYAKKQPDLVPLPTFGIAYVGLDSMTYFDRSNQVYGMIWEQVPLEWKNLKLHVNLNNNMELTFPSSNSGYRLAVDEVDVPTEWIHWPPLWIKLGDLIGVFDPRGELCAFDCYDGTDIKLTISGNNPQNTDIKGFVPGEQFTIQVFRPDSNQLFTLTDLKFDQGINVYRDGHSLTLLSFKFQQNATDLAVFRTTQVPAEFVLHQNFPNPFNPETEIRYELPQAAMVNLEIYNLIGQKVQTLVEKQQDIGIHTATWDGKDALGKNVTSGIYFCQLHADGFVQIRKLTLMR